MLTKPGNSKGDAVATFFSGINGCAGTSSIITAAKVGGVRTTILISQVECRSVTGGRSFAFRAILSSRCGLGVLEGTGRRKCFVGYMFILAISPRVGVTEVRSHITTNKRGITDSGIVRECCGSVGGVGRLLGVYSVIRICSGAGAPREVVHGRGRRLSVCPGRC